MAAKFTLGDIFIGEFPLSQGWAKRPEVYKRWGQAGHNGYDWVMPNGTLIVSPADGECIAVAEERDGNGNLIGFGRYVKILHEQGGEYFVSVYAHLQTIEVSAGQNIKKTQLIAKSDNNGFSSAPHLHFGLYLSDSHGNKIETNEFGGYHDPGDGNVFEWVITNPDKPYEPTMEETVGMTPDAKKALDILEKFKTDEGHGNLEGAINSLLGAFKDLKVEKESNSNARQEIEDLKGELRDRETFIKGQKETIDSLQKQAIEIAEALGVANDHAIVKGEIEKLISVEDDNFVLKEQIKQLKSQQEKTTEDAVKELKKTNKALKKENEVLENKIKELVQKDVPVDNDSSSTLASEVVKRWISTLLSFPRSLVTKTVRAPRGLFTLIIRFLGWLRRLIRSPWNR